MTPRIQKVINEIEKTRARIAESQERLRELERQKTELENTEIVALFRSLDVAPDQLPAFIAAMKQTAALPGTAPAPTAVGPAPGYPYLSDSASETEEDENEA